MIDKDEQQIELIIEHLIEEKKYSHLLKGLFKIKNDYPHAVLHLLNVKNEMKKIYNKYEIKALIPYNPPQIEEMY